MTRTWTLPQHVTVWVQQRSSVVVTLRCGGVSRCSLLRLTQPSTAVAPPPPPLLLLLRCREQQATLRG
jgi:hypothetical protein